VFSQTDVPKVDVYKAWVDTVNASGGINGHAIQLITEDDGGNPGTSLSDAQTLISDHVDAMVDISNYDVAWASDVAAAHIPVVGVNIFNAPFDTNPDFYPEGQTEDSSSYAEVAAAKAAGATNLGAFYCAEAVACAQAVPLLRSAGQTLGVPLVYQAEVAATAPNYTAQCVAAQQKHVAAAQIGDVTVVAEKLGANCNQQGYDPIYISEGAIFGSPFTTTAGLKNNSWFEFADQPYFANIPAYQTMNAAVDKYYPGLRSNATEWAQQSTFSWPSGILLEDAVKAGGLGTGGTPSAAEIVSGLESLKGDTLDGTAPPLTFAAGQPHKVDCWFTGRVQNGVAELVDGGKLTCENS
jgi:branched-chain amino acid transport system substrate-binding protein